MNAYDVYVAYIYMRQHMTRTDFVYDQFTNTGLKNGQTRLANERFKTRFTNIAKKAEPRTYLIGNFIYTDGFVATFTDDNYKRYDHYKRHVDAFKRDLNSLDVPLNYLIRSENDNIPPLLQKVMNNETDIITLIIINNLLKFHTKWKTQPFASIKTAKKLLFKIEKLSTLIEIDGDANKYRLILLDHFERLKATACNGD
ncbi:DNA helicase loader protein [Rhizobium phage RHph_I1_18]|nr:DNA helicase loader protein [Rhizobium phage RHph_I1_18]